jgi:hypothetical protein
LAANHDPKAQDVIIFLTDGESNYGPCTDTNGDQVFAVPVDTMSPGDRLGTSRESRRHLHVHNRLQHLGPRVQGWKSSGTGSDGQSCNKKNGYQFNCNEVPSITAVTEVASMASDSSQFFNEPSPSDLTTAFETIAEDLVGPRLVDDDYTG